MEAARTGRSARVEPGRTLPGVFSTKAGFRSGAIFSNCEVGACFACLCCIVADEVNVASPNVKNVSVFIVDERVHAKKVKNI
jgi:hypothetical protein